MNLGNIEKGYITNRFKDEHVARYLIMANNGSAYGTEHGDPAILTPDEALDYFVKGCIIGEGGDINTGFIPVNAYVNSDGQVVLSYFGTDGTLKTVSSAIPETEEE